MDNKPNSEHNRDYVEYAINSIPVEFFQKFSELKKVVDLTKDKLAQGVNPDEVLEYIKTTEEFMNLEKRQEDIRDFQDELEGYDRKKDQAEYIKVCKFFKEIDMHANNHYFSKDTFNVSSTDEQKEWCTHSLSRLGLDITYENLVEELAKLGQISQIGHAFSYKGLLSLLNGTIMLDFDRSEMEKIYENKDKIVNFLEDLKNKYKLKR